MFRSLVVIMCICYLAQPLNKPLNTVFHSLTHYFEIPDQILHSSADDMEISEHHQNHSHAPQLDEHDHVIIDFLTSALEANEPAEGKNPPLVDIVELEKHLATDFIRIYNIGELSAVNHRNDFRRILEGHSITLLKPPIS